MELLGIVLSVLGIVLAIAIPFVSENVDEACESIIRFWIDILPRSSKEYWQDAWIADFEHIKVRGLESGNPKNFTRVLMALDLGRVAVAERIKCQAPAILKRSFDFLFSLLGIVVVGPLLAILYAMLRLQGHRNPIYGIESRGRNGQTFHCLKFRIDRAERKKDRLRTVRSTKAPFETDQITPFGAFMLTTGCSELPQVFNIFRGEMSAVGPRPIPKTIESQFGEALRTYDRVQPGLTGLWQLYAKNTSIEERISKDVQYVRMQSFWNDLALLLLTFPIALGIDPRGSSFFRALSSRFANGDVPEA